MEKKILCHKIEEEPTNVGKDGNYPTQIIVDSNLLKEENTNEWIVDKTNIRIKREHNGYPVAGVDGFTYEMAWMPAGIDIGPISDYTSKDGKIGLFIVEVSKDVIENGLFIGSSMEKYEPGAENKISLNKVTNDGYSYASELVVDGKSVFLRGTGHMSFKDPGYEEEVKNALAPNTRGK